MQNGRPNADQGLSAWSQEVQVEKCDPASAHVEHVFPVMKDIPREYLMALVAIYRCFANILFISSFCAAGSRASRSSRR